MTLAILFSLKSMETLENGLQPHSGASSQSCRSIDTDAWCKRALNETKNLGSAHYSTCMLKFLGKSVLAVMSQALVAYGSVFRHCRALHTSHASSVPGAASTSIATAAITRSTRLSERQHPVTTPISRQIINSTHNLENYGW